MLSEILLREDSSNVKIYLPSGAIWMARIFTTTIRKNVKNVKIYLPSGAIWMLSEILLREDSSRRVWKGNWFPFVCRVYTKIGHIVNSGSSLAHLWLHLWLISGSISG
jgi:hypothetical protein